MNSKIGKILEFDRIIHQLEDHTTTALGKKEARNLQPMSDSQAIETALTDIDEVGTLASYQKHLPIHQLQDLTNVTKRLDIGADLNGEELAEVNAVLQNTREVLKFFRDLEDTEISLVQLPSYVEDLQTLSDVAKKLNRSIGPDGSVYDEASTKLRQLRSSIKREQANTRVTLENIMHSKSQYLSDDIITMRNDRYVLPVKAEYRHSFGGVIHDQSASGQTLYIEPQSVVDANNHIQDLQGQERNEIERIYSELSADLAPYTQEIQENNRILGHLDFIQAKFDLAKDMHAHRPKLAKKNQDLYLKQAVHPFLDPERAVANDIYFGDSVRMIVITGSNTGGKTVTLRTVGLLQLMGQSGLYITAEEGSQIGVFSEIFADIGDEQSIEANLSTFSGHMTNIVKILDHVDSQSLVLMDELGSGTDPNEGAALARAILNYLSKWKAMVMVTTHYPELKTYAFEKEDAINASVEFDEETLTPTYRLHIGQPGRSNGIDIAKRLGLEESIVEEAKSYVDQNDQQIDDMLASLESARKKYEKQTKEVNQRIHKADNLLHDLKEKYRDLKHQKDQYIGDAKHEANEIVATTKDEANRIISEIREWQKENPEGSRVKESDMIEKQHELDELTQEEKNLKDNKVLKKAKRQNKAHQLEVGDEVKVIPYNQNGTIVEKRSNDHWVVQMGALKMELPASDLEYREQPKENKESSATVHASKAKHVSGELDLRGMRYNEAMDALDQYIDSALLAGYKEVTIIHGYGTGAIRNGVQKYLKKNPRVESYEYAPYNQGGNGATVVHFKD